MFGWPDFLNTGLKRALLGGDGVPLSQLTDFYQGQLYQQTAVLTVLVVQIAVCAFTHGAVEKTDVAFLSLG